MRWLAIKRVALILLPPSSQVLGRASNVVYPSMAGDILASLSEAKIGAARLRVSDF